MSDPRRTQLRKVFIDRGKHPDQKLYDIADKFIAKREDLDGLSIAIVWELNGSGRGEAKAANQVDYQLHGFDVILFVPKPTWEVLDEARREALLDALICSIRPQVHGDAETKMVEKLTLAGKPAGQRPLFRVIKRPESEFPEILARHGVWTADLVEQQKTFAGARQMKLAIVASDSTGEESGVTAN
jgi:hypothetical protein